MHVPPVPGWRLRASNLGLPTRFATSDDPQFADPFIGNVDNHAYFLAGSPTATGTQWWVAGIDVESGKSMFKPVPLNIAPWAAVFSQWPDSPAVHRLRRPPLTGVGDRRPSRSSILLGAN